MEDKNKTKIQLISELADLRQKIAALEKLKSGYKDVEEALRVTSAIAVEEKFRSEAIIAAIGDGISIQDTDFRILYQNQIHKNISGGDHIGEHCYEAYAKSTDICRGCPVAGSFRDGKIHVLEKSALTDNGIMHIEIKASPLKDQTGKIIAGIEVVRDITDRKKIEEALRYANNSFNAILQASPAAIMTLTPDGIVTMWNAAAEQIFGWKEEEVIGKFNPIVPEDKLEEFRHLLKKAIEGESLAGLEVRRKKKDGQHIDVSIYTSPLYDSEGKISGVLAVIIDITERKKFEAEIQRSQRIESLSLLAGGIAHNFNNILTAIAGNLSLAKMYAKPGQEVFDILEEAEKASLKAKNLVQQLLTFSKGGIPIKETISMDELIRDTANFALSGSNVRAEFSIANDLWLVKGDERQISQVINNLIINAMQSMSTGGAVRISAENVSIGTVNPLALKEGKYVKIVIEDQGIGIPDGDLQKIFDLYFTTRHEGSGLGLATVYSIIKKHDGHITVESKVGIGTIFHIYLPAEEMKSPVKKYEAKVSVATKGMKKVLVMEDEQIIRSVLDRMLAQCGHEADFAKNGGEAIALYKKARESGQPYAAVIIDLIITDGMGGKEAIERLREIDPDVKAIVSSGYSNDPVMSNFRDYGFKSFLAKPYKLEELCNVLTRVIEEKI
ncbi:MAG: PAS domain S-box protein [Nitrospirota bacterium]